MGQILYKTQENFSELIFVKTPNSNLKLKGNLRLNHSRADTTGGPPLQTGDRVLGPCSLSFLSDSDLYQSEAP